MPNGGSDCCGTCWFNTVNAGKAGYTKREMADSIRCEIRDFVPESAFWTYCANHPHHNPDKIRVPIGPVYICAENSYSRVEKMKPLDSEEVRKELIKLAEEIPEVPSKEYPSQTSFYVEVIKHIGFIREPGAELALIRVLSFNPFARQEGNIFNQNNVPIISRALEALATIAPATSLVHISPWVTFELPDFRSGKYDQESDRSAPIRYHAVRALSDVESPDVISVLKTACNDPHPEIQAFANEILRLKIDKNREVD